MAVSIDDIIEKESRQAEYRKVYNQRPEVVERRKLYNKLRLGEAKVGRRLMIGEITYEEAGAQLDQLYKEYEFNRSRLNGNGPESSIPAEQSTEASSSDVVEEEQASPKKTKNKKK